MTAAGDSGDAVLFSLAASAVTLKHDGTLSYLLD